MVLLVREYELKLPDLTYTPNDLGRLHLVSFTNAYSGQITIRGEIFSMTDDDGIDIPDAENAGDNPLEYCFYGRAGIYIDRNPLVIMNDPLDIFVGAKGHGDRTRHRPGQVALILLEIAGEVHILVAGEDSFGR